MSPQRCEVWRYPWVVDADTGEILRRIGEPRRRTDPAKRVHAILDRLGAERPGDDSGQRTQAGQCRERYEQGRMF